MSIGVVKVKDWDIVIICLLGGAAKMPRTVAAPPGAWFGVRGDQLVLLLCPAMNSGEEPQPAFKSCEKRERGGRLEEVFHWKAALCS